MRALDVYAGIGGWSAGLRCAHIDVVEAFEIWPAAVDTYNANLGSSHTPKDVRALDLSTLPADIQLVVGSPPCTEFSLANRGGGGDIAEGLKDVVRFLEIVEAVQPLYWLMENVPRTAALIRQGLNTPGHALFRFRFLRPAIEIVDLSEFGLPQSRSRCLVGNFPFELLLSYRRLVSTRTLGQVLSALSTRPTVIDPVWGFELPRAALTEMEPEPPLDGEQLRMNREAKRYHPVYNDMAFPDDLDRPARTVTATCTRVSRESIVVSDKPDGAIRRLTVRERASLQGFPLTYQFFASSHSQKVKMIGNAVPPYFAYLAGLAAQEKGLETPDIPATLPTPAKAAPVTPPHAIGVSYPQKRRFRAAIPGLRFKSGTRFQLSNEHEGDEVRWVIEFFYGPSKEIQQVKLDGALFGRLSQKPELSAVLTRGSNQLNQVKRQVECRSPADLQASWIGCSTDPGPYDLVDSLGRAAVALLSEISLLPQDWVSRQVLACCAGRGANVSPLKLTRNAPAILAGLLLGSWFNRLDWTASKSETPPAEEAFSI